MPFLNSLSGSLKCALPSSSWGYAFLPGGVGSEWHRRSNIHDCVATDAPRAWLPSPPSRPDQAMLGRSWSVGVKRLASMLWSFSRVTSARANNCFADFRCGLMTSAAIAAALRSGLTGNDLLSSARSALACAASRSALAMDGPVFSTKFVKSCELLL